MANFPQPTSNPNFFTFRIKGRTINVPKDKIVAAANRNPKIRSAIIFAARNQQAAFIVAALAAEGGRNLTSAYKGARNILSGAKSIRSGNQEVSSATVADNGVTKNVFVHETLTAKVARQISGATAMGQYDKYVGGGSSAPPGSSSTYGGAGLFNKVMLPQGSVLKSTVKFASSKFPSKQIAQPAKVCVFKSDIELSGNLEKSLTYTAKDAGINQTHVSLFPIGVPQLAQRRLSMMYEMSLEASRLATKAHMTTFYDEAGYSDYQNTSNVSEADRFASRKMYCPVNSTHNFSVSNLNSRLASNAKISIVQCKGKNTNASGLTHNVYSALTTLVASMKPNTVISGVTATPQCVPNQYMYGLTEAESVAKEGAHQVMLRTPARLQHVSEFDAQFRTLKTFSFNIQPGCSREVELHLNRNINFAGIGATNDVINWNNTSNSVNQPTDQDYFILLEMSGVKNQQFYKSVKDNVGLVSRTWSKALSAPVRFNTSLEINHEYPLDRTTRQTFAMGGATYKSFYLDISTEKNVSLPVDVSFDTIVENETDQANNTTKYIVPVNADGQVLGTGVRASKVSKV